MSWEYRATETFWRKFYALSPQQKASVREKWPIFKEDPFDARLHTHSIRALSGKAKQTVWSVVIEGDLRVLFVIRGNAVVPLDVGSHAIYK